MTQSLTMPTQLLLQITAAPGRMMKVYGENRTADAALLAQFGFVETISESFGPDPSGEIAHIMIVQATRCGVELSDRIAAYSRN